MVVLRLRKFPPAEVLIRLDVDLAGASDDFVGKHRTRRLLVEVDGLEIVADILLVERRRIRADRIALLRPEARGVGREAFVGEDERTVRVLAELELRIRDDDALRRRVIGGLGVEADGRVLKRLREVRSNELLGLLVVDRLVVVADRCLGGRGEEDFVELRGVLVARAELLAVDRALRLVFLPAGAGEVTAGDALDLDHVHLLDQHGTSAQILLVGLELDGILVDVRGDEVVLHPEELHPEEGELVEDLALVGHSAGEDDVESADTVGDDHQELVAHVEHVADLAALLGNTGNAATQSDLSRAFDTQSVINKLEGANVVFGDKSELCSAAALLATAVMHKDQFRKCVLDAANLIDRLGGE